MTATRATSTVVWVPEDLQAQAEELGAFSYVVVEETVGLLALLRRWPWPAVDQHGRLIWSEDNEYDNDAAAVPVELLRAQLYAPNGLRRRPRCGDAFAVRNWAEADGQAERQVNDLRTLFTGSVYDISADAREAAKLAHHAALGAVHPAGSVDEQIQADQAKTLRSRTARQLRALRIAAPPRRPR